MSLPACHIKRLIGPACRSIATVERIWLASFLADLHRGILFALRSAEVARNSRSAPDWILILIMKLSPPYIALKGNYAFLENRGWQFWLLQLVGWSGVYFGIK
jgi:hypothetical protein